MAEVRRPLSRAFVVAHGVIGIIGVSCVLLPGKLANVLDDLLPDSFTVASTGTSLPSFGDIGSPLIRRFGLAVVLGVACSLAWALLPHGPAHAVRAAAQRTTAMMPGSDRARAWLRGLAIFVVPFAVFLWLSTPHNAFSTNSRIHWVDYLTSRSNVFFYAGGRIPHFIFYEHPPLWQAINAGLVALTIDAVLRRLRFGRWAAGLLSIAFLGASIVLLFADTGEDVMLNLLFLSVLLLSLTQPRPLFRGLALALVVLGRPEFFSMLGAYAGVAAYEWSTVRREQADDGAALRGNAVVHAKVFAWAVAGITASQIVFTIFGDRYLFTGGRILDLGPLEGLDPSKVDGFKISQFSGAYFGHFLWVLPIGFLVCLAMYSPRLLPSRRETREPWPLRSFVAVFCILAALVSVLLHELKPLSYFNVRYLSYTYPFVFVGGCIAIEGLRVRRPRASVLLWTIAIGTLVSLPVHPLEQRELVANRVETQLFDHMDELRTARDGGTVILTFGGQTSQNAMAYIFRTDQHDIVQVKAADAATSEGTLLVAKRSQNVTPPAGAVELLTTDDLVVYQLKG